MDETLRAELARAMGMKASEVTAYAPVDGGHVAITHDGIRTLVTGDGRTQPYEGEMPKREPEPSAKPARSRKR